MQLGTSYICFAILNIAQITVVNTHTLARGPR